MDKRVAIVSDVVMKYGGAEKVLEALLEIYPESDLITLFITPAARVKVQKKFPKVNITVSPFQWLIRGDRVSKYVSVIKIWSWIFWELVDVSRYDIVISSSHSFMSKNVKKNSSAKHLAYIHTPPRYLYDEFNEIGLIRRWPVSWLFWPVKMVLKWVDKSGTKRPDVLVVNSENVRHRVWKYYGRESVVVYPPVEQGAALTTKDYYIFVSRLVRQKGVGLIVGSFVGSKRKLVVVGDGDEWQTLKSMASKNIVFVRQCNDDKKMKLMAQAKALIYMSEDEDFGIVPVEALKLGVPVIAHNSGGVKEVVKDHVNGVLFDNRSATGLESAISRFEHMKFKKDVCRGSVSKFGKEIFKENIKRIIENA